MSVFLIPIICAFAGWLLMQIAVALFFSPARSKKLVTQMAASIGNMVDMDSIVMQLTDAEKLKHLKPAIEAHLDEFLEVKLQQKLPVIATFVGPSTLGKIKEAMVEEIDQLLPQVISQYAASLANDMDISQVIAEKLNNSSAVDILIASAIRPQIKLLGIMGAAIGLLSGVLALLLNSNI